MVINPICNSCGNELNEFGALMFSMPNQKNEVKKYHLCQNCFKGVTKNFRVIE